jgi:methionyl-tRNA formyltransferase
MVSAAFPYTVPAELLQLFPDRAVNLHPALLPAYRGPYPLFGMMFRNEVDRCGGVTLHQMVPELDAGPIIAQEPTPWNSRGFRHWEADLGRATYRLANVALPRYLQGAIQPRAQQADSDVYFRNVDSELLQINRDRTAERAKYLLDSIGSYTPLRAHVGERSWRVSGFLEILADHPLGTPPRISSWRIEMDVSDARIALRRWIPFTSKLRRWNTFRLFARIQDAA